VSPTTPGDAARARELFGKIDRRLDSEPELARRVSEALRRASEAPRSSNRRAAAALDPTALHRKDPGGLRPALEGLELDQLKDIVSQYAMDPSKLALKWKRPERLIDLICSVAEQRARKGDAFRS
jgi:hypothetical protein